MTRFHKPYTKIALNNIRFQSRKFCDGLTEEIAKITSKPNADDTKRINDYIRKELGMNVNIDLKGEGLACIHLNAANRNHIFFRDALRKAVDTSDYRAFVNRLKTFKERNVIDLRKGTLSGIYTEMPLEIDLHVPRLRGDFGMQPEEIAAVLSHECGHGFTMFMNIGRQVTTNQVLSEIFRSSVDKDNSDYHEMFFKELASIDGNPTDYQDAFNSKDFTLSSTVIISKEAERAESQLGFNIYDARACEEEADNFVVRLGYGEELMRGLDKIHKLVDPQQNGFGRFFLRFSEIAFLSLGMFDAVMFSLAGSVLGVALIVVILLAVLWLSATHIQDHTYDSVKRRYLVIRQNMIVQLKKENLDTETVKRVLDSIDKVDKIIDESVEYRTIFNVIGNFIFSNGSDARKQIQFQQLLESLANNDLFLHAQRIKSLT